MYVHIIFSTKKISPYFSPKKKKKPLCMPVPGTLLELSRFIHILTNKTLSSLKKKQKTKQTSFGYTFIRIYGVFNGLEQENVKCFG